MRATLLQPSDHSQVEALLEATVAESIFLLGMLERRRIGVTADEVWWGVKGADQRLIGLAFLGTGPTSAGPGLWVCAGPEEVGAVLGKRLGSATLPAMCIGPRATVDALWVHLGSPPHRLAALSRVYACTDVLPSEGMEVRPATLADLDWVRRASVEMMMEDLGLDPRAPDPDTHETQVRASIKAGRTWVGTMEGVRVFRLEVGTRGQYGAQVGGTWVPPSHRGHGLGAQGMATVCAHLLRTMPRVALHVREENLPAIRCYTRIGFRPCSPLRLLVR